MLMDTKKAVGAALVSQGKIRKDFVVLDGDLSGSTQTFQFAEAYPDRFVDCGIAFQRVRFDESLRADQNIHLLSES